jgi:hypothetical protein
MRFVLDRQMRPSERLRLSIDFTKDVERVTGDTASAIAVAITKADGTAAAPAIVTDIVRVGNVGYATVDDPVALTNYLVNYQLTTTLGFKYEHDIFVPARTDG